MRGTIHFCIFPSPVANDGGNRHVACRSLIGQRQAAHPPSLEKLYFRGARDIRVVYRRRRHHDARFPRMSHRATARSNYMTNGNNEVCCWGDGYGRFPDVPVVLLCVNQSFKNVAMVTTYASGNTSEDPLFSYLFTTRPSSTSAKGQYSGNNDFHQHFLFLTPLSSRNLEK